MSDWDDNQETAITPGEPTRRRRVPPRRNDDELTIAKPGGITLITVIVGLIGLGVVAVGAASFLVPLPPKVIVRQAVDVQAAQQEPQVQVGQEQPPQQQPRLADRPELIRVAPHPILALPVANGDEALLDAELIYRSPQKWSMSVAVSPDGKRIAFAGQFDRFVMDLATREAVRLPVETGSVSCFSGDGSVVGIVSGFDAIFATAEGEPLGTVRAGEQIMNLGLSRDGKRCVTGLFGNPVIGQDGNPVQKAGIGKWENCRALVWDTRTAEKIATAKADDPIWASAFSEDGSVLTNGLDGLRRFDAKSGEQTEHAVHGIQPAGFSAGGRFLAGTPLMKLHDLAVWDVGQKQLVKTVKTPGQILHRFALSRDGRTAIVSGRNTKVVNGEGSTSLWDITAGKMLRQTPFPCHYVSISDDGAVAVFGDDEGRIWRWTK